MERSMAERALRELDAYKGNEEWDDIILACEGFDPDATAEADPSYQGTVAVFEDGSRIEWDAPARRWRLG